LRIPEEALIFFFDISDIFSGDGGDPRVEICCCISINILSDIL